MAQYICENEGDFSGTDITFVHLHLILCFDQPLQNPEKEPPPGYEKRPARPSPGTTRDAVKDHQGRRREKRPRIKDSHRDKPHNGNNLNTYSPFLPTKRTQESVTETGWDSYLASFFTQLEEQHFPVYVCSSPDGTVGQIANFIGFISVFQS